MWFLRRKTSASGEKPLGAEKRASVLAPQLGPKLI